MAVTIEEIARQAGVSRSTVSRALKNDPRISDATIERIHDIADALGYVPNYIARSLSINRTRTIGMVITHPASSFIWRVIEGVELAAHERGYNVFLSTARNNRDREMAVMQSFQRRRVDGIIISSSHMKHIYSQPSAGIDMPVILINEQFPGSTFRSVANDDYAGARLGADYLVGIGHGRIGYTGIADRPNSNERRYNGYTDTMQASGLEPLPEFRADRTGLSDFETGFEAADAILRAGVTAVFCYNDYVALGLMSKCHKIGITVPDELSVLGYDDIDEAPYAIPPLTTIQQPMLQMGYAAVEMLMDLLDGVDVENRILDCKLIVRDSTKPVEA